MDKILDLLQKTETQLLLGAAVVVLVVLIILRKILGGVVRLVRRKKPAELHPRLQKYAGRTDADAAAERQAAMQIVATSSTGSVAGYEIVRQVDAVFVEGLRSQSEAITALKAVAAQRGANAIINLTHQHTAAGRCTAQGDAVVIRAIATQEPGGGPQGDKPGRIGNVGGEAVKGRTEPWKGQLPGRPGKRPNIDRPRGQG